MKTVILTLGILFCYNFAQASFHGVARTTYRCSDGNSYDLVTSFHGGYSRTVHRFVALCTLNTVPQDLYSFKIPNSIAEVVACGDEDTPEIRYCMEEFIQLNNVGENSTLNSDPRQGLVHGD